MKDELKLSRFDCTLKPRSYSTPIYSSMVDRRLMSVYNKNNILLNIV